MMFDSLVCPLSSDQDTETEAARDSFEIFKGSTKSLCEEVLMTKTSLKDYEYEVPQECRDPILTYLQKYYLGEGADSCVSDAGELSWDEGDMPHLCLKVWTFNDFMEQYNEIYAWLNNIQVQYHADKRKESASPRVETLLRELERDVARRERFLRETGRMVTSFPELEEEVTWRLDHVMTKWEMLGQLRAQAAATSRGTAGTDIYQDIEAEVRCLRRWLREMEARIDPLQFSSLATWSARDRERKMAEYQVLQTDIESHGRIVKLVLGLCEELGARPGEYDAAHAVKVAAGLERRWHHIWLRSLEWQCLLEQLLTSPGQPQPSPDTEPEEEPRAKVARLNTDLDTLPSPAVTLLRRKRRKRLVPSCGPEDSAAASLDPEKRIKLKSPRTPRVAAAATDPESAAEDRIVVTMATSESDPSTESAPSTSRSESSDSVTFIFSDRRPAADAGEAGEVAVDNRQMRISEWSNENMNNNQPQHCSSSPVQNHFIANTVQRKVTVIRNSVEVEEMIQNVDVDCPEETLREDLSLDIYSQDSLDEDYDGFDAADDRRCLELLTDSYCPSDATTATSASSDKLYYSQENLNNPGELTGLDLLHFGEDYRVFINSLSDASVTNESKYRNKKLRRKNKRREMGEGLPYESQSEAETEDVFLTLSSSQRQIHAVEDRVNEYLAQGFVGTSNLTEYDDILAKCSENVNILHNFLQTIDTTESFVARKKCRETRLLISRWENLLQKLLENVNNSKVFESLKDESKHLRDITAGLEETIQAAITDTDLQTQMTKLKAALELLTGHKAGLDTLVLRVHNFLADLGTSAGPVEERHLQLADSLKDEVLGLYADWDAASARLRAALDTTEEAARQLRDIERELIEFRRSVRSKQLQLVTSSPPQRHGGSRQLRGGGGKGADRSCSSHDSGISTDAGSGVASDCGLPEALEQLARLRRMTARLEATLGPGDPSLASLAAILGDTSLELESLQRLHLQQRPPPRRKSARSVPMKAASARAPPRRAAGRGRRLVRLSLAVQAVLLSLVLVAWLAEPQCCDNISAISFSPSFKFVNGPPPI